MRRLTYGLAVVFGLIGPIVLGSGMHDKDSLKPVEIGVYYMWLVMNAWMLAPCAILAVVAWKAKSPIVVVGNLVLTLIVGLLGAWMYLMPKEAGMIVGSEGNWSVIFVQPLQCGMILVGEICLHAFSDYWIGRKK